MNEPFLFKRTIFNDNRGFFSELYNEKFFKSVGIEDHFVQTNYIFGNKFVLRGIHHQREPMAQAKALIVLQGKVLDVIVDVRNQSSYGRVTQTILGPGDIWYIPINFSHGMLCLEDNTHAVYLASEYYAPEYCVGIAWNDPTLKIDWGTKNPVLSERDTKWGNLVR